MFAEERHQRIVELTRTNGRVDASELASTFGVSIETIRRDLATLERHGLIKKVHGGAMPLDYLGGEPALAVRDTVMTGEKERIVKTAFAEIPNEGSVLIDAGTTTSRLAEIWPSDRDLTVVTNALPIASALAFRPRTTVLMTGGKVRGKTLATVDDWALQALASTYVDVAFIGANGISAERGLTTPDIGEAAAKRAMISAARRVVVLADHTKFGNDCLSRFADLSSVDLIITDTGLDHRIATEIEAAGPKVVRA
ncbi:DeoR/GlpR family DNA-binding transcription regulator [Hoyosella subflava]|uniref:Lactose phosphotransferase system repressor n=1 Tax=Hoyosella subflava (strain DSM 45089 / JCM 17490 / NBRC 109087 / DQS3-9A1) TaxID=443218 RepID=F6EG51_HOYSD|nr:DeoR/GlpR family DNA-binding transcription regulator [Hoyosella subflava]AEF38753.1 Transcriptional regulator, DeoR family [Hoyosella subflava DQS3-9A1]